MTVINVCCWGRVRRLKKYCYWTGRCLKIPFIDVENQWARLVIFGGAKGSDRLVHTLGPFWDMLVHIRSLETVSDKSAKS